jgi:xanthosine utilization system XapX-like protein
LHVHLEVGQHNPSPFHPSSHHFLALEFEVYKKSQEVQASSSILNYEHSHHCHTISVTEIKMNDDAFAPTLFLPIVLGTLFPPPSSCKHEITNTHCESITLILSHSPTKDGISVEITNPIILKYQSLCIDESHMTHRIVNRSLILYDLNDQSIREAVRLIATMLTGVMKIFVNLISALPIAIIISDILGLNLNEHISDMIRKIMIGTTTMCKSQKDTSFSLMSPHIGIPLSNESLSSQRICDIHGRETDITLQDLDGEFILCRNYNCKVPNPDSVEINVLQLFLQCFNPTSKITMKHWVDRTFSPNLLLEFIITYKVNISILGIVRESDLIQHLDTAHVVHLKDVITERWIRESPHPFHLMSARFDLVTASIVSRHLDNDTLSLDNVVDLIKIAYNKNERLCRSLCRMLMNKTQEYNIFILSLFPSMKSNIMIGEEHVSDCINHRIPLSIFAHLCQKEHVRSLLAVYDPIQVYAHVLRRLLNV